MLAIITAALLSTAAYAEYSAEANVPASCPPPGFASISDFDLDKFIAKRWYIQQQMVTKYLPKKENWCVFAEYRRRGKKNFWGYDVVVHNWAEEQNRKVHDSGSLLLAKVVDEKTGKLEVAPWFLPTILAGPYWVIDYDEADGYALISGGPPTHTSGNGYCRTGYGTNKAGLWIFTRKQQRDHALVTKVRGIAQAKGFDLSVLNDVDQSNCAFPEETYQRSNATIMV